MDNNENLIEEFTFLDKEGVKFVANEILNTQHSLNDLRNQVNNIHVDIPDTGIIYNSNMDSIAEGIQGNYEQNSAEGQRSHAEGIATYARSEASHAEGYHTETYNAYEHAQGSYNISHSGSSETNTIHSIGIGVDNDNRKNAMELTQNGDLYIYGVSGYDGTSIENVSTLQEVINQKADLSVLINYALNSSLEETNINVANNNSSIQRIDNIINNINSSIIDLSTSIIDNELVISNHITSLHNDVSTLNSKCDNIETTVQDAVDQLISSGAVTLNVPIIDLTNTGLIYDTSIEPNKMYMFGEKEELTINELMPGLPGIVNEYLFQFTSSSTGTTTLLVPNTVVWIKEPDIQTDKKYAVSIENNLGIIGEWSNE